MAYLAKKEGTGISATLDSLREVHPAADPNDGFMEQLLLFQHMGYRDLLHLELILPPPASFSCAPLRHNEMPPLKARYP